jgi:hypothetical protein
MKQYIPIFSPQICCSLILIKPNHKLIYNPIVYETVKTRGHWVNSEKNSKDIVCAHFEREKSYNCLIK